MDVVSVGFVKEQLNLINQGGLICWKILYQEGVFVKPIII